MSAPEIRLEAASKWYGEVLGLNEVTATFEPGVHGLLGPNGAGKSTLMKLVTGMLRPSLGRVRVAGEDPFDNPEVLRRLGLCPEQDAVYAGVPILAVVTYLTRLQGFTRREAAARATRALERVGLGHVLDRSAAGFSKGMRQRAKLAQALAHDPDVLVLDEPLNGLDPPGRRDMGSLISELGREGKVVLVSSHILPEVEGLARRVLLLHAGRVLAEGTVAEIRAGLDDQPLTVRVGTGAPRRLAALLAETDGVRHIEIRVDQVECRTTQPDRLFDRLAQAAKDGGLALASVEPVDEDLEAVFRYLTR